MCAQFLEASPQVLPTFTKVEVLVNDDAPSSDEKYAPKVELKPLSSSLRYEFLGSNSTYHVIVNVSLNASQVDPLQRIFRMHCKAIGYIYS